MTAEDLLWIFKKYSNGREISTQRLYRLSIKEFHVDDLYEDYEHYIRSLQQTLKNQGLIRNNRHGYWILV